MDSSYERHPKKNVRSSVLQQAAAANAFPLPQPSLPSALQPIIYNNDGRAGTIASNSSMVQRTAPTRGFLGTGSAKPQPGRMTPVERQEARLQALLAKHAADSRKYLEQKQRLVTQQIYHLGTAEPLPPGYGDAQARLAARLSLIEQLSQDMPASETFLESVKQGRSITAAIKDSERVHHELQDLRAGTTHSDNNSNTLQYQVTPADAAAQQQQQHHPGAYSMNNRSRMTSGYGSHGNAHSQGVHANSMGAAGVVESRSEFSKRPRPDVSSAHVHQSHHAHGQQSRSTLLWHGLPIESRATTAVTTTGGANEAQRSNAGASAKDQDRQDTRDVLSDLDLGDETSAGRNKPSQHKNRSVAIDAFDEDSKYSRRRKEEMDDSPAYVKELKSQVEALRTLMEQQMQQQQALQQQAAAPAAPPVIMQVPWPGVTQPPAAAGQASESLPADVLALDPGMRGAHARHVRDLTLLKWEIERARTAAELEQLKASLQGLQLTRTQAVNSQDRQAPGTGDGGYNGMSFHPQSPSVAEPQPVLMMDVQGQDSTPNFGGDSDNDDTGSDFTEDDDVLGDRPTAVVPGTVVRADVLHVHIQTMGPVHVRGTYRLRVVLYDGFQPVYVGPDVVVGASTARKPMASQNGIQSVVFNESISLRGLSLSATMMLVFELYLAKQPIAGMPAREDLAAWAYTNAVVHGQVLSGKQLIPVYRLPIMMSAQRHFSYHDAMLEFGVSHQEGDQGLDSLQDPGSYQSPAGTATGGLPGGGAGSGGAGSQQQQHASVHEDVPGVPSTAWLKVARAPPPPDPYTPGEGFTVAIDAARFLPGSVTITKVVMSVVGPDHKVLGPAHQAMSMPDSDALSPQYATQYTVGQGGEATWNNAAATLLFTVYTRERYGGKLGIVGYAALPPFLDPKSQDQPVSKNVRDYILNQGAFQIPLYVSLPGQGYGPFKAATLAQAGPRLPCATLLVRIVSAAMAKRQRKAVLPAYSDRVYDSFRSQPTQVDVQLYPKYLSRKALMVREAARLLQPGGSLPASDPELLDWIEDKLQADGTGSKASGPSTAINYNLATEYYPDLGFYVSVDGAMRLPRNLPSGAILTFAPPGSFYQDNPVVDDLKCVVDPAFTSCMAAPRWLDGWQHFTDVVYEPGLAVIIDIRLLVPGAGTSAPAGWTVLPVFERLGPYVGSGLYQLPLFQGVPSRTIIQELAARGDVDAVVASQLKTGRMKLHEDCCSVFVRLADVSRQAMLASPATAAVDSPQATATAYNTLRLPAYANELGPRYIASMRKALKNKTYAEAKPGAVSDESWKDSMAVCLYKAAGLQGGGGGGGGGAWAQGLDGDDDDDDDII